MDLNFKRDSMYPNGITPTRGTEKSAGIDLYSISDDFSLSPGKTMMVHTGICFAIPDGYVGLVFPRSGLATKYGLRLSNCVGVIDSDYRGEIIVPIYNDSDETRKITRGLRVAQMVVIPYADVDIKEVGDLDETDRGTGGFGSTGY